MMPKKPEFVVPSDLIDLPDHQLAAFVRIRSIAEQACIEAEAESTDYGLHQVERAILEFVQRYLP